MKQTEAATVQLDLMRQPDSPRNTDERADYAAQYGWQNPRDGYEEDHLQHGARCETYVGG